MVFIPPLAVEKCRNWGVLLTPLRNLQMRKAFIAALTSEKNYGWRSKKVYSAIGHWYQIFFIAHLSILVRSKTKGADGAVCALLRIKCLMANYCLRWRRIFKRLLRDGGRVGFSKKNHCSSLFNEDLSIPMSIISARSISLDSSFNYFETKKLLAFSGLYVT